MVKNNNKQLFVKLPTISVIIPTFNSRATIERCLASIRKQNYPQNKIEIIIVDGGSTDSTLELIKKFRVKLLQVNPKKQNVELNKLTGIKKAKGELLLMIDHDNILPHKGIIKKMVKPFLGHKGIVGVETTHYHYDRRMTLLDRYFALFGVADPLAYYLGKADRMSYLIKGYDKRYSPIDYGDYFLVEFNKDKIPTIGANGFLIKRKLLLENASVSDDKYFPIDVNVDLIRKGFNKYAFVKDSITHISGHGNVGHYLKRRMLFVRQYYLGKNNNSYNKKRRYSLYESKDFWKLIIFIAISVTFVIPLIDSLRGYRKIADFAWFLHPVMCFGFVVMYGYVIIEHKIRVSMNKLSST